MKTVTELKNLRLVRLNYFSEYDSEKCNNGGCYGFWTDYTHNKDGNWEISYGTTAEFEYCPCCGSFEDHYDYDLQDYSCCGFEKITTEELLEIINSFKEDENNWINFFYA